MLRDLNVTEVPIDRTPPRLDDLSAIEALKELRNDWDIQDAWRLSHPNEYTYTYCANINSQEIKSRLGRIYIASQLTQLTFNWEVTMDHWLVLVKYAPADAPEIGRGRWTLPLHMMKNKKFLDAVIKCGMFLQTDLENLQHEKHCVGNIKPPTAMEGFQIIHPEHHKKHTKRHTLQDGNPDLSS